MIDLISSLPSCQSILRAPLKTSVSLSGVGAWFIYLRIYDILKA